MLTPIQTTALQSQITASGQSIAGISPNPVVLKLYMTSLEYQHIHNYPESGQYVNKRFMALVPKSWSVFLHVKFYFSIIKESSFFERSSWNIVGKFYNRSSICSRTWRTDVLLLWDIPDQHPRMHLVLLLWRTQEIWQRRRRRAEKTATLFGQTLYCLAILLFLFWKYFGTS